MNDREAGLIAGTPHNLLIGGRWVGAENGDRFPVLDPATGDELASVAAATPTDGIRALDAAHTAAATWAGTAPRERGELLRRAWQLLQDRREDFALLMTLEMGKPLPEARAEVAYGGEFLRWFSEEAVRISGRFGPNPEGSGHIVVSHRPVGPAFLITPWNFPLAMATRKIAPALAAGCTVVIKPAELTPLTTLAFAQLLIDAGLPAGVVNVIPTDDAQALSAPIIADPRLRKLSFTGSTKVGRTLLKQAADGILRTSMELGGNAPFLVFEDADLDKAVAGALQAKFRNIGQACTAANRFLVHESVTEEFGRRLAEEVSNMRVGRGTEPGIAIGPLIDQRAVQNTADLVDDALHLGARVLAGGAPLDRPGNFFAPTVLTHVPAKARMVQEEIFAPVLAIRTFTSEAEGIQQANATQYGLVGYAFTRDLARAQRLIDGIDTGMLGINTGLISNAAAPFGGVKQSGLGREGGTEGIHEYLEAKYTLLPAS